VAIIRIILIIILAYFLIRFLDRHVVPYLFGKPEEKSKPGPETPGKEFRKKTSQGEVTIKDYGKKKDVKPPEDDYVDYEEIK
jgi:hypothetical protein